MFVHVARNWEITNCTSFKCKKLGLGQRSKRAPQLIRFAYLLAAHAALPQLPAASTAMHDLENNTKSELLL